MLRKSGHSVQGKYISRVEKWSSSGLFTAERKAPKDREPLTLKPFLLSCRHRGTDLPLLTGKKHSEHLESLSLASWTKGAGVQGT